MASILTAGEGTCVKGPAGVYEGEREGDMWGGSGETPDKEFCLKIYISAIKTLGTLVLSSAKLPLQSPKLTFHETFTLCPSVTYMSFLHLRSH